MHKKLPTSPSRLLGVVALGFLIATVAGCAKTAKVSGHVKFGNDDLKAGRIRFVGANGKASDPAEIKNGEYSVRNAPIGECTVVVETEYLWPPPTKEGYQDSGKDMSRMTKEEKEKIEKESRAKETPEMKAQREQRDLWVPIPDEYTDEKRSSLKYTVKRGGGSDGDFTLKKPDNYDYKKARQMRENPPKMQ
jgi:hypothetical protein